MTSLVHDARRVSRSRAKNIALLRSAWAFTRAIAGWPLRVHANRKILHQMAGMSPCELADIGLTPGDLRDTAAMPLHTEVGQFLAARVRGRRDARHAHR